MKSKTNERNLSASTSLDSKVVAGTAHSVDDGIQSVATTNDFDGNVVAYSHERNFDVLSKNWNAINKVDSYKVANYGPNKAVFTLEPLEPGFGMTIALPLRRILLSSIRGLGIIGLKIYGVEHQYSTIEGVLEDVIYIIANLKKVVIKGELGGSRYIKGFIHAVGPCKVIAGMIKLDNPNCSIVNTNQYICTVGKDISLDITLLIDEDSGYRSSDSITLPEDKDGGKYISMDAIFSPVRRVNYEISPSRIGASTGYDKLDITVETNGAVAPDMAVFIATKILHEQTAVFNIFNDTSIANRDEVDVSALAFDKRLLIKISNLELSVRSHNCLSGENIIYLGDLVVKSENQLLMISNFGRKSLHEIRDVLTKLGLTLGMRIPTWPPPDLETLAKQYNDNEDESWAEMI